VAVSLAASERHPDARPGLESRETVVHSVGEGLSKRARDHDLGEAWHERDGTREPRFFARGEDAARAPRAPRAAERRTRRLKPRERFGRRARLPFAPCPAKRPSAGSQ